MRSWFVVEITARDRHVGRAFLDVAERKRPKNFLRFTAQLTLNDRDEDFEWFRNMVSKIVNLMGCAARLPLARSVDSRNDACDDIVDVSVLEPQVV